MSEIAEKLKNNKLILFILIIGTVMLVFPFRENEKEKVDSETNYAAELEGRAKHVLSSIEGVGNAEVMITLCDDGRTYPVTEKGTSGERTVSTYGEIAVSRKEYPKVRGVVAVVDGADDENVKTAVINALYAVTGAPLHNICVFKMK